MENAPRLGILFGCSGSGKTKIAEAYTVYHLDQFGIDNICQHIEGDHFYKQFGLTHPDPKDRARLDFDHPLSVDSEAALNVLRAAKLGQPFHFVKYNFTTHRHSDALGNYEIKHFSSGYKFVLAESILFPAINKIRDLADVLVCPDTPPEVALLRRIPRDIKDRGRSFRTKPGSDQIGIYEQLTDTVIPNQHAYVLKHLSDPKTEVLNWYLFDQEPLNELREELKVKFPGVKYGEQRLLIEIDQRVQSGENLFAVLDHYRKRLQKTNKTPDDLKDQLMGELHKMGNFMRGDKLSGPISPKIPSTINYIITNALKEAA